MAVRASRVRGTTLTQPDAYIAVVPTFEELLERWDDEQVVIHHDPEGGAWVFICLHSTRLGPAAGGTRMKVYDAPADGLADAMRLSAGMTAKLAVAGLDLGGGKTVLAVPELPQGEERRRLLHRYGDLVASLRGSFLTSSDINTGATDMDLISERTEHVFGRSESNGGAGNPAPYTASGVLQGIRASLAHVFGSEDLAGRSVLVQGAGSVGAALAQLLGWTPAEADVAVARIGDTLAEIYGRAAAEDISTAAAADALAAARLGVASASSVAEEAGTRRTGARGEASRA